MSQQIATTAEGQQAVQHVSQALVQGALELSAIVDRRLTRIREEHQAQINALTQQVNALVAQNNGGVRPEEHDALVREVEALRRESESWRQDRAGWDRANVEFENVRANWLQDREALSQDRERLQKECEGLRAALEESQRERTALQQQLENLQTSSDERMKEAVAAAVHELEARVRWLEATQSMPPPEQPTVLDQTDIDPLDIFQSPQHLQEYPAMSSTLGTMTSTRSPSPLDVSMQVGMPQTVSLISPFEFNPDIDAFFAPILAGQLDDPPVGHEVSPQSPTVTLRGGQSPPASPTIAIRRGTTSSVARSSTLMSITATATSSQSSGAARFVIRVPPSSEPVRKPIKTPISPPSKEELEMLVHVPTQKDSSSPVGSPAAKSTKSSSTSSSSPGSSSSASMAF
ncbi:hypothetical protein C2E23DRAFT_888033 [Lenzites betulinus]|nr:hypothetical protein C2E23DRAFT_888033 [Lenzites betulinus]